MGEEVGAFLRLRDGAATLTHDDIVEYCRGRLSHFKIPRYVVIVDEFPRTLSGKVQKFKFLDTFSEELAKILWEKSDEVGEDIYQQ